MAHRRTSKRVCVSLLMTDHRKYSWIGSAYCGHPRRGGLIGMAFGITTKKSSYGKNLADLLTNQRAWVRNCTRRFMASRKVQKIEACQAWMRGQAD
jgi:hypothetical protein